MTGLRGTTFYGVQGDLSELPEPPRLQLPRVGLSAWVISRDLMWQDCGSCGTAELLRSSEPKERTVNTLVLMCRSRS